jgi:uncharacterized phage-associated protein
MLIIHDREKLINAIAYFAKNTRQCGIVKLNKLLYFLDFYHYRDTGRSVTGLDYYAWKMGPVAVTLYNELKHTPKQDLTAKVRVENKSTSHSKSMMRFQVVGEFDPRHFTKRELRLLSDLASEYNNAKAEEMIHETHLENQPWHQVYEIEKRSKEKIPYEYAVRRSEKDFMVYVAQANEEIKYNYQ